jgi:hypothetical protein
MRRSLFVAGYLLFCLLLLEVALQFHYRVVAGEWLVRRTALPLFFAPDEDTGFRLRPNLALSHRTVEFATEIYTDSAGLRVGAAGDEIPVTKPDGVRRMMLLGPSFAFGWGVDFEDTFLERLREHRERIDPTLRGRLDNVNAGVPALGPIQQLAWFRRDGIRYAPDLVIQIVYGSLEVSEEYSEGYRVDGRGYLVPRDSSEGRRWLGALKRSAIVFQGWRLFTRWRASDSDRRAGGEIAGAGRPLPAVSPFDPASDRVRRALAFYEELQRTVHGTGAELLILTFPLSYVVHPEDLPRWSHLGVSDPESRRAFETAFAAHLNRSGILCLDLSDTLIRAAQASEERLYYFVDIHWTPAGHDAAARAVAEALHEGI